MFSSYLKISFVRFKKTEFLARTKEYYIDNEENNHNQVIKAYLDCANFLKNGEMLKAQELVDEYNFEPHYHLIYQMLIAFSLNPPNLEVINEFMPVVKDAGIEIEITDDEFLFKSEDLSFSAKRYSQFEPSILNLLTDIEKPERKGTCHPYSVVSTLYFGDNGIDADLVTGRIYQLSNKENYLHSWMELKLDNEEYVIDSAKNLVIPKYAYYEINHVNKVSRVPYKELKQDYPMIRKLTDYDSYIAKIYYDNPFWGRNLYKKLVKIGEIKEPSFE